MKCLFDELIDICLEMAAGICLRIKGGWFDFGFIYLVSLFGFLYGLYIYIFTERIFFQPCVCVSILKLLVYLTCSSVMETPKVQ